MTPGNDGHRTATDGGRPAVDTHPWLAAGDAEPPLLGPGGVPLGPWTTDHGLRIAGALQAKMSAGAGCAPFASRMAGLRAAHRNFLLPQSFLDGWDGMAVDALYDDPTLAACCQTGARAPPFALPDAVTGAMVSLADLLATGPAVVVFHRGTWCLYCKELLVALSAAQDAIAAAGGSLAIIGPDTPETAARHLAELGLGAVGPRLLCDAGLAAARAWGVVHVIDASLRPFMTTAIPVPTYNGDATWALPRPATFVVDTDGIVVASHLDLDYTTLTDPAAIAATLRALQSHKDDAATEAAEVAGGDILPSFCPRLDGLLSGDACGDDRCGAAGGISKVRCRQLLRELRAPGTLARSAAALEVARLAAVSRATCKALALGGALEDLVAMLQDLGSTTAPVTSGWDSAGRALRALGTRYDKALPKVVARCHFLGLTAAKACGDVTAGAGLSAETLAACAARRGAFILGIAARCGAEGAASALELTPAVATALAEAVTPGGVAGTLGREWAAYAIAGLGRSSPGAAATLTALGVDGRLAALAADATAPVTVRESAASALAPLIGAYAARGCIPAFPGELIHGLLALLDADDGVHPEAPWAAAAALAALVRADPMGMAEPITRGCLDALCGGVGCSAGAEAAAAVVAHAAAAAPEAVMAAGGLPILLSRLSAPVSVGPARPEMAAGTSPDAAPCFAAEALAALMASPASRADTLPAVVALLSHPGACVGAQSSAAWAIGAMVHCGQPRALRELAEAGAATAVLSHLAAASVAPGGPTAGPLLGHCCAALEALLTRSSAREEVRATGGSEIAARIVFGSSDLGVKASAGRLLAVLQSPRGGRATIKA